MADIDWIHGDAVKTSLLGLGFDRVGSIAGTTYKDSSTIIIVPSRNELFHRRIVQSWQNLIRPMNQKSAFLYCTGDEVGVAYNRMIKGILADKELSTWKYVMTMETDNVQPPDAQIRLLESINKGPFDAVSGLYWTKGDINMPMAYGDAHEYRKTGVLDFKPLNIQRALQEGETVEVLGIAMGCSLYRMDLFRQIPEPWFVTVNDVVNGAPQGFTQDLFFCKQAVLAGKRFAVDMRVKVGHLDLNTNELY